MNWLKPNGQGPTEEELNTKLEDFFTEYGPLASIALDAWNSVDPFRCFFDINADEYLGYARRFVEQMQAVFPDDRSEPALVEELVRRSFAASQVITRACGHQFAADDDIQAIAGRIAAGIEQMGLDLEELQFRRKR